MPLILWMKRVALGIDREFLATRREVLAPAEESGIEHPAEAEQNGPSPH